jgi:hypothetical protein
MPLQEGTSPKTVSSNVHEMLVSESFGKGKSGKKRRQMASASAYRKGRESGGRYPRKGKKSRSLSSRAMSSGH